MQGSQISKRVSWATDPNLCQVRLFLSEEPPSQAAVGAQDHLQAKKTLSGLHINGLVADDNLPPGFEGFNPFNQLKDKLANIPQIKWRAPPKLTLDSAWQVVSGEESREVEIQNHREVGKLEAYYPRQSAIPPNPASSPDLEVSNNGDQSVLLIPITPVEEEDAGDPSTDSAISIGATICSTSSLLSPGALSSQGTLSNLDSGRLTNSGQQDLLKAALSAVTKTNEQIDHDLLVKILSNPAMLEQLVRTQEVGGGTSSIFSAGSQTSLPKSVVALQTAPTSPSSRPPFHRMELSPSMAQANKVELGPSSSTMLSNGILYPHLNSSLPMLHQQSVPPTVSQIPSLRSDSSLKSAPVPSVKDINYYKSLIQQHGGERQAEPFPSFTTYPMNYSGSSQDVDNSKQKDRKPKSLKPCLYFNSTKGCRHGANCIYQHDTSVQQRVSNIAELQSAKRMKTDRDNRGSQPYI